MRSDMKFIAKKWQQQGAILALTALLLPMIIVGTGLAVDLGNVYVQYSRLQNAADAAALAGAHEYAVRGENENSHPKADAKAEQYVQGEYHNLSPEESIAEKSFKAKKQDAFTYYRVKLTKKVPLYFLGHFYGDGTFEVSAAGVAAIKGDGNGSFFNNMFIFKNKFSATNDINNADKLNPKNPNHKTNSKDMIITTFDGRVVYTRGDGKKDQNYKPASLIYSTQANDKQNGKYIDRFFTTAGKEYNHTHNINELVDEDERKKANFEKDGTLKGGYWSRAEYYNYDFNRFYDYMKQKTADTKNIPDTQEIKTDSKWFNQNVMRVKKEGSVVNVTIRVNKNLGNTGDPVYIYIEKAMDIVNIELDTDTGRPLIICIEGDENQYSYTKVHMNLNGHTFKGVVYAPYSNDVLINANGGKFSGTLVGGSLDLQGGAGYYEYKDYIGKGGGTGTNGSSSSADGISLVSPPGNLDWN